MYCTHCSAQNQPNSNFCIACGKSLKINVIDQQNKLSKEAKIFIITFVSLAIVIAAIYSFFFIYEEKKSVVENQGDKPDTEIISDEKQDINSMPSKQNFTHIKETRFKDDCYVVITASFESEENAKENVQNLIDRGYSNAGYFWRPDYYSTSVKAFYVSFIGPYNTYEECRYAYNQHKHLFKGSYGINISQSAKEEKIRD